MNARPEPATFTERHGDPLSPRALAKEWRAHPERRDEIEGTIVARKWQDRFRMCDLGLIAISTEEERAARLGASSPRMRLADRAAWDAACAIVKEIPCG